MWRALIFGNPFNRTGIIWKNGIPMNLTDSAYETFANSVAVSGNDVYVVGNEFSPNGGAIYWKNGNISRFGSKMLGLTVLPFQNTIYTWRGMLMLMMVYITLQNTGRRVAL